MELGMQRSWMSRVEYMSNLNLAERFREMLRMFKLQGGLRFAELGQYRGTQEEYLSVYFDEDFIYLPAEVFKVIVESTLPGYHYSEVYRELVEEGHAKGENSHVFPKVTLKHVNGGQRIRVAKLQRQFLLSDEEILLGVEYGQN